VFAQHRNLVFYTEMQMQPVVFNKSSRISLSIYFTT